MTQTAKGPTKLNFVGEVFPFSPLSIDEGSSRSMPKGELGGIRPQPWTNPLKKGEEDRNDALHLFLHHFPHPVVQRSPCPRQEQKHCMKERRDGQNTKSGGSDPTWYGFQPPK
jgi:hypothetical protein